MNDIVKIPNERVKVLMGKNGITKRMIEKKCNVVLIVEKEGNVRIGKDPTNVFFAMDVVKAIGRGFHPSIALKLLKDDFVFYLISMKEVVNSNSAIRRLKGRVIGEKGRIKTAIENATDSYLSIYGNTISIIAPIDSMEYAKEAVWMLLNGAKHATVLKFLSKSKRTIMEARLKGKFY